MTNTPLDLLPIDLPMEYDPSVGDVDYFYKNVTKHLIVDMVKLMTNGITVDFDKVKELEEVVVNVLATVATKLASNAIIEDFNSSAYPKKLAALKEEFEAKERTLDFYIKEYKDTMVHRTYAVNVYLKSIDSEHCCKGSWSVKELKGLNIILNDKFITRVINKDLTKDEKEAGMLELAKAKLDIYKKSLDEKLEKKVVHPIVFDSTNKEHIRLYNIFNIH